MSESEVSRTRKAATMEQRLRHLHEISLALTAERNIVRLLELILSKSRDLTNADGGTLYLVRGNKTGDKRDDTLYFRAAQSDSIRVNTAMSFAVSRSSLAGYTALTGETLCFDDVYELPPDAPYKFNPSFDREHGYRTKSILVVPLKNHANHVIGVLQLINCKRHREVVLSDEAIVEREVQPFEMDLQDLAAALASQAAVALENNILLKEIENLFDSFVTAAASAIEDRDPCTSGHTERVMILTEALAEAASAATEGPFEHIHYSPQQIRELRYASMMHDFGKIGVRESILTKSHKLEPMHFQAVKARMLLLRQSRVNYYAQCKIETLLGMPREAAIPALADFDRKLLIETDAIDSDMAALEVINDPAIHLVPEGEYEQRQELLARLTTMTYLDETGVARPLLTHEEYIALSIRKGSLTKREYEQIQQHAQMSYEFLEKIEWTEEFRNIPNIAYCHHEKLNGKGYPRGVSADDIPLQARMMTVSDIFDAITASDRPYKKALPVELALKVLESEARDGGLDKDVVDLFISQAIYRKTEAWYPTPDTDAAPSCEPIRTKVTAA